MTAPKGNQFWKVRSSHGRNPIFESPDQLWEAATEYFQWVDDHPLLVSELVKFQGQAKTAKLPKLRAMTEIGLCIFLDISDETWRSYKSKEDFVGVTTRICAIIYEQKFTAAAADLLNPNIIARDLGLFNKAEKEVEVKAATPMDQRPLSEQLRILLMATREVEIAIEEEKRSQTAHIPVNND